PALTTPGQLAGALGVELKPPLKPTEVQRLRKALPGYASTLDDTAELLTRDGAALGFDDVDPQELVDLQRRYKQVRTAETLLETVHQSVYHQRLQLDDQAMGRLQRIVRRVQSRAEEDPQLPLRWGVLLDFMGAFRKGGRSPAPVEPVEPSEPEGDEGL
ncbi:MAG TPA: hypothetical protein VFS43_13935, partial [Polyangiaceae bacterium]|nr:hypothetical protein [Polyangiaceae bacterium]